MDHSQPHHLADPIPDRALGLKLQHFAAADAPRSAALPDPVSAELDRHEIAVVPHAVYEWSGYRYTNALDAIAAAKRGRK